MKKSVEKRGVWGHPQLLGYIDLNGIVEPVITRDEIKRSRLRSEIYDSLVALERFYIFLVLTTL